MPLINKSEYNSPYYLFSRHLQTILPALFRKVGNVVYTRERIFTPDHDFLDLDWSKVNSKNLVVISHGLEGDSIRPYVLGMVRTMNIHGFDVLAWNYRGCSGEINKLHRSYHSGYTEDLDYVIRHALEKYDYEKIILIGFSVGGNITLKYLGEKGKQVNKKIKCAVTFSVPCHLESGAHHLAKWKSKIYMARFLKSLRKKMIKKSQAIPEALSIEGLHKIKNFLQFDERYTAPMNGFKSARDYWKQSSCLYYLPNISIPSLLVNARNDPFLTPECYPIREAESNPHLFLEMPETGGHCGFFENNKEGKYWSEKRAVEFIRNYV
ncbi:MAG: alpha/beta fold hydrolase [Cytophagaceae bacterium]|nr:alpha/beta fold hydrolase [Cytophagaceae bacterium]